MRVNHLNGTLCQERRQLQAQGATFDRTMADTSQVGTSSTATAEQKREAAQVRLATSECAAINSSKILENTAELSLVASFWSELYDRRVAYTQDIEDELNETTDHPAMVDSLAEAPSAEAYVVDSSGVQDCPQTPPATARGIAEPSPVQFDRFQGPELVPEPSSTGKSKSTYEYLTNQHMAMNGERTIISSGDMELLCHLLDTITSPVCGAREMPRQGHTSLSDMVNVVTIVANPLPAPLVYWYTAFRLAEEHDTYISYNDFIRALYGSGKALFLSHNDRIHPSACLPQCGAAYDAKSPTLIYDDADEMYGRLVDTEAKQDLLVCAGAFYKRVDVARFSEEVKDPGASPKEVLLRCMRD
jgi:hypothetical protein